MTEADILAEVRDSGFPCAPDLSDTEVYQAIAKVKRDLRDAYPLSTFGTFTLYPDQQVYDLFNSVQDLSISQGVFPDGRTVLELVWNPGEIDASQSIFGLAPFLQGLTIMPGEVTVYSFSTPSDWWIWDRNWGSWVQRFGPQTFEQVENRPGAPIRIYPVPKCEQTAVARYQKFRDPETFLTTAESESAFATLVKANCAYVVHRKLNAVAGVTIGTLKQDGKSALYWKAEGDRLYKEGWEIFRSQLYEAGTGVARS